MNVIVVGGTGFIGRPLTHELIDRGHSVTVLSRSPSSVPDGVRSVSGDVRNAESISDAFEGMEAVINLVALSPLFEPSGNVTHKAVHLDGTRNIVEAAKANGVEKIVQMSALGADPDGATAYIRAKGQAEAVVTESPIDQVIVRPSVVFGEGGEFVSFTKALTTPYITGLPGGGGTRFQPIWVGDLVPMLAAVTEDGTYVGKTLELGGPETLTLTEITRLVYRTDGKRVVVLPIPMLFARIGLTIASVIPGVPMGPDQYRSLKFDNTVSDNDVTAFGETADNLRTLTDYLEHDSQRPS
ncbi:complex I NDUFA9 subunit family protein [Halocatena marina]|uniref:Complex I NDUFA9 subunit family protein n=1 Tax=Halocatena marina TaxID=2934937 RepID=A0ABD5YL84_9EURY|nr:complex I NDUFA9 subunit family protein [Halocatena marina]